MKSASKAKVKRAPARRLELAMALEKSTPPSTAATHFANVDPALSAFDHLPDSSFVRLPVVRGLFACSSVTVWRRVKAGTLPTPRKLSPRVTAWNVGSLREALRRVA